MCIGCVYCVGVAEKIGDTGNVDTINISRLVISVSLMLFSCVLVCGGSLFGF